MEVCTFQWLDPPAAMVDVVYLGCGRRVAAAVALRIGSAGSIGDVKASSTQQLRQSSGMR